ncbi:hypothetical protein [Turneriella parva]|uniref:Uncharacterized protein n=1 Tax=Turneriella parva (strain ATCC BAA-1111 / DSM 21527 / NCTC 11395 / H) TaxID=869212 RepID=I4B1Q0_TURPD|nr:hypothetical protein [Turneriella parva]AFM11207.1 hypothetical protein Turpa_0555 [Turneriella parva DSM 21527]
MQIEKGAVVRLAWAGLVAFLLATSGASAQDEDTAQPDSNATEETTENQPEQTGEVGNETENQGTADEKLITAMLEDAANYKSSYEDSTALQEKKGRQLKKKIAAINKKNIGRTIRFSQIYVYDVEAEQSITKYGKTKARSIIQKLRRDPQTRELISASGGDDPRENPVLALMVGLQLMACKKCMAPTGRFEVTFTFDEANLTWHKVVKVVESEAAALRYKKGQAYAVSGQIVFLEVNDELNVKLHMK